MNRRTFALVGASIVAFAGFAQSTAVAQLARAQHGILPPNARPLGLSYSEWSVKWWQWCLSQPLEGHPSVASPAFQVSSGQSGPVWFLAAPLDTNVRSCTIPWGKALFVGVINSEWSSLEGYATEEEQREFAAWYADHMHSIFVTLDGVPVANIGNYRSASPQFTFTAPSPWLFGPIGGTGTAVSEGTYVYLLPPSIGTHVLHFGGAVHFAVAEGDPFDYDAAIDMTYNLTVAP
jgi:hypothetical protein